MSKDVSAQLIQKPGEKVRYKLNISQGSFSLKLYDFPVNRVNKLFVIVYYIFVIFFYAKKQNSELFTNQNKLQRKSGTDAEKNLKKLIN